jgi:hypothetical protein
MKRVGLWALGIGVLASVGLLTVAQGFADENDRATKCTLATLRGDICSPEQERCSPQPLG